LKPRTGIGVWLPVLVAILFWALFMSDWVESVEGLVTDLYTRHAVVTDDLQPRVLIVRSHWSVEERAGYWKRLIDELERLDPAGIALSRLPDVGDPDFHRWLGNRQRILVGRGVVSQPEGTPGLQSWPSAASSIAFAVARLASVQLGIARFQRTHIDIGGRRYPVVE